MAPRLWIAAVIGAVVPALAHAQGLVRLSWSQCDPWVQFAGPDDIDPETGAITQVVSIRGESRTNRGHLAFVRTAAYPMPDAWRFYPGGCPREPNAPLGEQQIVVSTAPTNAFTCPAFKGVNEGPGFDVRQERFEAMEIELSQVYVDAFTPDPGTRYTMWQIVYPLARSQLVPPGDPSYCPGLEQDICFLLQPDPQLLIDVGNLQPLGISELFVTWPRAVEWNACFVAARASTWGRVKGLYR